MSNGVVLPNTEIAVDYWRPNKCPWVKHFFLSHMHGDHTAGLSPSWRNKLYCSELTKKLVVHKLGIDERLISTIEIGVPRTIFNSDDRINSFSVTLFDANHCPGSVMFLFEGQFGKIFYSADFRCDEKMLSELDNNGLGNIDVFYLDNTYLNRSFLFPPREEATKEILNVIEKHPNHQILIICYSLGKEDLLLKIAEKFKEWIIVNHEKFNILKVLDMPNVFSTNIADGRIRVGTMRDLYRRRIIRWITGAPTIAVFPTGLSTKKDFIKNYKGLSDYFFIPYSDHSCFREIEKVIKLLKPSKIVPIVKKDVNNRPFDNASRRFDVYGPVKAVKNSSSGANFPRENHFPKSDRYIEAKKVINKPRLFTQVKTKKPFKRKLSNRGVVFDSEPWRKQIYIENHSNNKINDKENSTTLNIAGKDETMESKPINYSIVDIYDGASSSKNKFESHKDQHDKTSSPLDQTSSSLKLSAVSFYSTKSSDDSLKFQLLHKNSNNSKSNYSSDNVNKECDKMTNDFYGKPSAFAKRIVEQYAIVHAAQEVITAAV